MLEKLSLENFGIFRNADVEFGKGINVIIGSNGTGKSQLLKLAYTTAKWSQEMAAREKKNGFRPDKLTLQKELASKLTGVFLCDTVGRLSSREQGTQRTQVKVGFSRPYKSNFEFSFSTRSTTDTQIDASPEAFFSDESIYFPTKEVLTMYPGFAALYRDYSLQFDSTYYDLCLALERPLLKGARLNSIKPFLKPVEDALNGSVYVEKGRFYLSQPRGGHFEISLVAEGFRKLGTIAYLLANGTLAQQSILFWDEPETNLNPAYMVTLAKLLVDVSKANNQVILATHSLFLLRELSMQLNAVSGKLSNHRFFALSLDQAGKGVSISSGYSAEEIEPIAALDAELEQSDRYFEANTSKEK